MPVAASLMHFELPALFALALAVYPMMRSDGELSRREGMVLLVSYVLVVVVELVMTSA
jgi:cation:H+ antiporter